MNDILKRIFNGDYLTEQDISYIMSVVLNDTAPHEQIAALLGALAYRGASAVEISYLAKVAKQITVPVELKSDRGFMDISGTGGDYKNTFNISSVVSFIVAAAGVPVIKHGFNGISSICGSADVFEELGINIHPPKEKLQDILNYANMVFLYAPDYNSGIEKVRNIKNAIAAPTVFNILAPLINPVSLTYQVLGVYDGTKCALLADVLLKMGLKEAFVVHSCDGMDEFTTSDENIVFHLKDGSIHKYNIPPLEEMGLSRATINDLVGGDRKENARIAYNILNGERGPKRDVVLLNAAASLVASEICPDFYQGVICASNIIDSGKALDTFEKLKQASNNI